MQPTVVKLQAMALVGSELGFGIHQRVGTDILLQSLDDTRHDILELSFLPYGEMEAREVGKILDSF